MHNIMRSMVHYGIGTEHCIRIILAYYTRDSEVVSIPFVGANMFRKENCWYFFKSCCDYFLELAAPADKSPGYVGGSCCKERSFDGKK